MDRENRITSHFGRAAESFDQAEGIRRFSYFGRRLAAAAGLRSGAEVLDVAAGRGAVLFPAAEQVGPSGRVIGIDLAPRSLLVMDYDTQLHYNHAVPKTSQAVGERISLAFRVKPDRPAGGARGTGFYK